jgi:hypothetical protein
LSSQVTDLRGIELEAWINFLRAHAAVTRQFNAELLATHALTINDYDVLAQLSRAPEQALKRVDLAESVLPILQKLPEARFESVELTDMKMYLKVVTPQLKFEMAPGDIVQAGVVVSNSEVGQGTLSVQTLLYRLRCRNGLITPDRVLRKTHVGRAIGN